MRRTGALIFALIGVLFIRIAMWFDLEAIRDVTLEAVKKFLKDKPPARKPDPSNSHSKYDEVERYTMEDFEEPY